MWGEGQFQESVSRSIFFQAGQDMQQKMLVLGVECMECHHSGAGKLRQVWVLPILEAILAALVLMRDRWTTLLEVQVLIP
jgi:hypothetical protein